MRERVEGEKIIVEGKNGKKFTTIINKNNTDNYKSSSKEYQKRVDELKEKYEGVNDFDFETIVQLEDEYFEVVKLNPEHTKRRREILMMRRDLLNNLKQKSKIK